MTYKVLNNTGLAKDTMVYNEETADRVVPGGLPVRAITVRMESGKPVVAFLEVDFVEVGLSSIKKLIVQMRIPGTQEIAEVSEIRYKDGRVFRLP